MPPRPLSQTPVAALGDVVPEARKRKWLVGAEGKAAVRRRLDTAGNVMAEVGVIAAEQGVDGPLAGGEGERAAFGLLRAMGVPPTQVYAAVLKRLARTASAAAGSLAQRNPAALLHLLSWIAAGGADSPDGQLRNVLLSGAAALLEGRSATVEGALPATVLAAVLAGPVTQLPARGARRKLWLRSPERFRADADAMLAAAEWAESEFAAARQLDGVLSYAARLGPPPEGEAFFLVGALSAGVVKPLMPLSTIIGDGGVPVQTLLSQYAADAAERVEAGSDDDRRLSAFCFTLLFAEWPLLRALAVATEGAFGIMSDGLSEAAVHGLTARTFEALDDAPYTGAHGTAALRLPCIASGLHVCALHTAPNRSMQGRLLTSRLLKLLYRIHPCPAGHASEAVYVEFVKAAVAGGAAAGAVVDKHPHDVVLVNTALFAVLSLLSSLPASAGTIDGLLAAVHRAVDAPKGASRDAVTPGTRVVVAAVGQYVRALRPSALEVADAVARHLLLPLLKAKAKRPTPVKEKSGAAAADAPQQPPLPQSATLHKLVRFLNDSCAAVVTADSEVPACVQTAAAEVASAADLPPAQ